MKKYVVEWHKRHEEIIDDRIGAENYASMLEQLEGKNKPHDIKIVELSDE